MDEYLGIIKIFGGNFAPKGWAMCNGQLLSIAQNTALFAILGTTYGGDGVTTFALPNLQGLAPIGMGHSVFGMNYTQGEVAGSPTTTLSLGNMPAHTHQIAGTVQVQCNADSSTVGEPQGAYAGPTSAPSYNTVPSDVMGNARVSLTNTISGGNQPFNNMAPYMAVNYIICLQGIFPSRN